MSTIFTIFIGMIGAGLAWVIGAPAPFLTGSATLVTLSALIWFITSMNSCVLSQI